MTAVSGQMNDSAGLLRGMRSACLIFHVTVVLVVLLIPARAFTEATAANADRLAIDIERKVIEWRRDIHSHPELSNREFRTAAMVAEHLESLGFEVRTGIAHTGVLGVLKGGKPGSVVALRADMDALPVTEAVDLPFASKVKTEYNGQEVGVMHACGHDCHTAILMGVAEVLSGVRDELSGTVKFIFQPAEEGAPAGEQGGAGLMVREGVLDDPSPEAVFALHVSVDQEAGEIAYRPGGAMASADGLRITVHGAQSHGAYPWKGVDPVVVSAQIILGLQTITSRQLDLTRAAAVVTVATIHGGVRSNIIPDKVELGGTIRSLDPAMRDDIHERIKRTAVSIAESGGATAEVRIGKGGSITWNDPALTERMVPSLRRVAGDENVILSPAHTGAEDFAVFADRVPSLYFWLGITPPGTDPATVASLHSPYMRVDEDALVLGVRAMTAVTVDYLAGE